MDYTGTNAADSVAGTTSADLLDGAGGADTLVGDSGADTVIGGDGADFLRGQDGDDSLSGGADSDLLTGGAGNDLIDGGAGIDRASYGDAPGPISVDLNLTGPQPTGHGVDTLASVEQLSGTEFNDTLTGDDGANWLWTLGGGDSVRAGGGDDLVSVGRGAVTADGGAGDDILAFYSLSLTEPVNVSLALQGATQATQQGSMTLTGFEGLVGVLDAGDTLTGDEGANTLAGWGGNDSLVGGAGADLLLGDGTVFIDSPNGGAGPVTIFADDGAAGADTLVGGDGADTLNGGGGADSLDGGASVDVASFSGARGDYEISWQADGSLHVSDLRVGAPDGADTLTAIETLRFLDGDVVAGSFAPSGASGADALTGGAADDALSGLAGDDFLRGGIGDDSLAGGADDDFLNGGAGNDVIDGGAGIDRASFGDAPQGVTVDLNLQGAFQDTGFGQDKLIGIEQVSGTEFADRLTGDDADNWLWSLGGNDTVLGSGGNDLISVGAGAVIADGGAGTDALAFYSVTLANPVNVSLALQGAMQATNDGSMTFTGFENLVGTTIGNDTLAGNEGDNLIAGWGGSDSLVGGGGADTLSGDGTVFIGGAGGAGPITFFPDDDGAGADTLSGGAGADLLIGGGGNDLLTGGTGADTLDGGAGVDTASYAGVTTWVDVDLQTGAVLAGGVAEDTLSGIENVIGTADWDALRGDSGDNLLQAGAGHDYLAGGEGADTLLGQDGDDVLTGGAGNDVLDGGAGIDRAAFSLGATTGVTVDLNIQGVAQSTGQGQDVLIGIEDLSGTRFDDRLTGNDGDNWLWGGSDGSGVTGNDTISAGGGADLVQVGVGDHSLDGGAGIDTLSFQGNGTDIAQGVTVSLAAQGSAQTTGQGAMTLTHFENLSGSTFGDTLTGDSGVNLLAGYSGSDSLSGGGGDDVLLGDGLISVDSHPPVGTAGPITTTEAAGSGADTLDGGSGSDLIKAGDGADVVLTGVGRDTVDAGAGADTVTVQAGAGETDLVTLGLGADRLLLDAAMGGTVTVTDFAAGSGGDVVDLASYLAAKLVGWNGTDNPYQTGFLQLIQSGSATLLQINPDGVGTDFTTFATLQNTSSLQLTVANLGFAPLPRISGDVGGDTFVLDTNAFVPGAPGHTIEVDGGGGTDTVQIIAPALVGAASTITPSPDGSALLMDLDGDGQADLTITNVEDIVINGSRVVISGDLSGTGLAPHTIHYQGTPGDDLLDVSGMTSLESVRAQGLAGADTLIGADSDDTLEGDAGADSLVGRGDNDLLDGGDGDDTISGGVGVDVAIFTGHHSDYTITDLGGDALEVVGADGDDHLTGVEQLQFDDGRYGRNTAPTGADHSFNVVTGHTKIFALADFGFGDVDGDSLAAIRIASLPTSGVLSDNGVAVTVGQFVPIADIVAGHLLFTPAGEGQASFGFQVQDDGLATWGTNLDASANTLSITTASLPEPPPAPPPPPPSQPMATEGADHATFGGGADSFAAGAGADTVSGGDGDDWLQGNAGTDSISGDAGTDILYGGRDNDVLNGGDGRDWLSGDLGDDSLAGGAGEDTAFGGDGADTVLGGDGESYLRGGAGDDVVTGGADFDDVHGNEGNDTVSGGGGADWVVGGKDQDLLFGDDGDDIVYGNLGSDTLNGGAGADLVRGGQGDDVVSGGVGDDWLSGDLGADTLSGGGGGDVFHSFAAAGVDRVLDFNAAEGDRVQLDAGTTYSLSQVGADTVISLDGGAQVILVGVTLSSLSSGWLFTL